MKKFLQVAVMVVVCVSICGCAISAGVSVGRKSPPQQQHVVPERVIPPAR